MMQLAASTAGKCLLPWNGHLTPKNVTALDIGKSRYTISHVRFPWVQAISSPNDVRSYSGRVRAAVSVAIRFWLGVPRNGPRLSADQIFGRFSDWGESFHPVAAGWEDFPFYLGFRCESGI